MANLNCKFKLCRDPEWKVSRPTFGSRPTICGPLVYCIELWATIIVRRQAVTVWNAGFHIGGPVTAGALRPVPRRPHS